MDEKIKVSPGWNDPPMLNYSASNPPPKSRIANKRIAFPLNSTASPDTTLTKPLSCVPPMVPQCTDKFKENVEQALNKFLNSEEAKQKFHEIWIGDVPEDFIIGVKQLTDCLAIHDKEGAASHQQTLLLKYKSISEVWLTNLIF